MVENKVIIVGGGLAGLTAALHLRLLGVQVLVLEKQAYPHHKVCGEYVSNEVFPYLLSLGVCFDDLQIPDIKQLLFSDAGGRSVEVPLPMGGKGISRFAFDSLLYAKAKKVGVDFVFSAVRSVRFSHGEFVMEDSDGAHHRAPMAIGAYGKRSPLDKDLQRDFVLKKSNWLAIKAHYKQPKFSGEQVGLHCFEGGYGGLSKTETGAINFCYLTSYGSFKKADNIQDFNRKRVSQNPYLRSFLETAEPLFDHPLGIAQVSFERKEAVEGHMIMCGDSAGLIHPLCGNGMAMAVHAAKLASEHIGRFFNEKGYGRTRMENDYKRQWKSHFKRRLYMGRRLQSVLLHPLSARFAMATVARSPLLLQKLIGMTHGKPLIP
ncbi:MAG: NAD(P)/FAD-dependent oxidoreductase [Sediminicola sp.]|tara:strand:- start:30811 stop:31938 length:1128 start_codon:yes stop_codon:yes gene_type:complete